MNYKITKQVFLILIVFTGLFALQSLQSRTYMINSERQLDRMIRRHEMIVVMFLNESREIRKDAKKRKMLRELKDVFSRISKRSFYKDAEMQFITINMENKDGAAIAKNYNITQSPSFIIINRGQPLEGKQNKMALLVGGVPSEKQLYEFIDRYAEEQIEDIINQKAKRRARRESSSPYFSVGYGYGYPYSYYPGYWPYYGYYGYGYPYGGFGVGWYW